MVHCPKCGKGSPEDFAYCVYCGTQLRDIDEQETLWGGEEEEPAPEERPREELPPVASIGFGQAIRNFFQNYANFKGRATRAEFWLVYLFQAIVEYGLAMLFFVPMILASLLGSEEMIAAMILAMTILLLLWSLGTLIPWLALYWRRLHDLGMSGANYFIGMVPLVGPILLIVWLCMASDGDNKYGPRRTAEALATLSGPEARELTMPEPRTSQSVPGMVQPIPRKEMRQAPVARIGFGEALGRFFNSYICFSGRASRAEFWYVCLFHGLVSLVLLLIYAAVLLLIQSDWAAESAASVFAILGAVYFLLMLFPQLSLCWRRLHDTGKSGAFFFIVLVPLVGGIFLIIQLCFSSDGDNKYGPRRTAEVLAAEQAGE